MADTADTTPVCISWTWIKAIFRPLPTAGAILFSRPRVGNAHSPASVHRGSPGPYGKGPLVEQRHGLTRDAAPSLGPWFRPRPRHGPPGGTLKVCGGTLAPCTAATALRPWPPLGDRWLRPAAVPGLRPAAGGVASPPWTSGPRLRWPRAVAAKPPPVAPPPPRPPARLATPSGRLGRLRPSVLRLALGLLRVGLTARPPRLCGLTSGPSAPKPRRVPPGRPLLVTAGRSVPSLRRVGRATGSAPPAWGLERPEGPLSQATGPRRRGQMPGKGAHLVSGWRGPGELCPVSAVSGNSINSYRNFSVGLTILADTADTASACIFRPGGPGRGEDYRVFRLPRSYKLSQPSRCSRS